MASMCKIKNPKVLVFDFNPKTGVLTASSRKPLLIENKGLGYLIMYNLIDFTLTRTQMSYVGYMQYKTLKGSKRKQRKWRKNRLTTYKGSQMHFVRSLRKQSLKKEGFLVHQFKRVKNKERPSDIQIKKAWNFIRKSGGVIRYELKNKLPTTALDSANMIIDKSKLPKFRDYLYKRNVPDKDLILQKKQQILLQFEDYLMVIYTKAAPEKRYSFYNKKASHSPNQTSSITLLTQNVILNPSGDILNPLDFFVEGYWAYKQFADLLPLNYQPLKD